MITEMEVETLNLGPQIISGKKVGKFLVHRPVIMSCDDPHWDVTHIKTGARFPWRFDTVNDALAFVRDIRKAIDWDRIAVERVPDSHKYRWITGPSREEAVLIRDAAERHGGVRD
jgi:hypothetical protein